MPQVRSAFTLKPTSPFLCLLDSQVEGFCPSARWPSDHVSVVADLCWVRGAGQGSESDCSAASAAAITSRPEYILPAQVSNATKVLHSP